MIAAQFPILEKGIYANHAAIAPWPLVATRAVADFAQENAVHGPGGYRNWIARERELRKMISSLIGASGIRDIALLSNTSEGISAVAYGYPWRAGDNVVIPALEFPSNRLPWIAQAQKGVEVREIDIRADDDPESALMAAMDERTRVLAVSSVQYADGLRLDLEKLGAACQSQDMLFCVDAIQQLGALPIDVQGCQIDCLAAGGHKWLLGPEATALFYCNENARARIHPIQSGWHMYDYPWKFEREDWTPSDSARRFEAGSPNSLGQVAMHASLSLLLDTGLDEISERILANTRLLLEGLSSLPRVTIRSPEIPERQSGIVSFEVAGAEPRDVYKRMMKSGVTCALRGGNIRLSPHFYQDEGVMDRLLTHVEDAL
jgi:cysteine desulfurase/selenocysteine lyase